MARGLDVRTGVILEYIWKPESYIVSGSLEKSKICNGCGPSSWKVDIVSDSILGCNIKESCNVHDWMYFYGEAHIRGKELADRVFLNNMKRQVDVYSMNWLTRRIRYFFVERYFEAVKLFGGPAYWENKNKTL